MTPMSRLWGYLDKRIGCALIIVLFMFLGYQGVLVMKSHPYHRVTYSELLIGRGEEQVKEEVKEVLSLQEDSYAPLSPLVVLVLSSMPRGGSTLLTELLSSVQDSVAVFEPLWNIQKKDCSKDVACSTKYLEDVLSCSFKPEFETWLKSDDLFFHYFSPEARDCLSKHPTEAKVACLNAMSLQERCEAAPLVIVKVIRARLSWIRNLLEDSYINLKVIHLTRDPRGSLNSIARSSWNANPHSHCSELEDDMAIYEELRQVFPDKVTQVRYERLCLRPVKNTKDIFRFLFGSATLPASVTAFLNEHMLTGKKQGGSMSTVKNSTQEFDAWRYKIPSRFLKVIEDEPVCVQAIGRMGHAVFGSYKNATDPKLPLILTT